LSTVYLAEPDKSYTKLPERIASMIKSDLASYSSALILSTVDSLKVTVLLVSETDVLLFVATALAAPASFDFSFVLLIPLSDL